MHKCIITHISLWHGSVFLNLSWSKTKQTVVYLSHYLLTRTTSVTFQHVSLVLLLLYESFQPCHSLLKTPQPLLIKTPSQLNLNFLFKNRAQRSEVDSLETDHLAQAWADCVWTWRNCLSSLSLSFIISTMEIITTPTYNIGLTWFPHDTVNKAYEIPLLTPSNFTSCNLPPVRSTSASPGLGLWLVFFLFSLMFAVASLSYHSELNSNVTLQSC